MRSVQSTIDLTVASENEKFHNNLCKDKNWCKHFKLPILRGNDKIGIQIVTNYLYIYVDRCTGKIIYVGVVYRFDESNDIK